ncbi:hypothetical protein WP12_11605 [Sphingomonas sp. SRS2]|nr:hypothetical protein WP12_11605 [Sphingomonas sp. SRS2]
MGFRQIFYGVLIWTIFVYALRRGGWEERLAIAGIIANAYLTVLVASPKAILFNHIETPILLVDLGLLALLLFISLRSEKYWPLWITAMHALTTLAHLSPLVPHMQPLGYWRAAASWSWPILIVLVFGIRAHHRERSIYFRHQGRTR